MIKHSLKIIDIIDEGNNTKTYLLEKPSDIEWEEGSHAHIAIKGYDEQDPPNKALVRHMSIMSLAEENHIGFTTRFTKQASEYKSNLINHTVGDELILFKLGSRMRLRREDRPIVLLSMGVGIATMRPLILSYLKDQNHIPQCVHINVDALHQIYQTELDAYKHTDFKQIWTQSRVEYYQKLTELKLDHAIYYVVGSDVFLRTNIQKLKSMGVSMEDIMIDKKPGILQLYYEF